MMLQWHACKEKAGTALLLFRMGEFYEAFYDDAATIARELDLTLTKRQDIPMSGVPVHTSEIYIDRLVSKGYRVALAEQLEDPKQAKGIVQRGIVRTVTPGTVITSGLLSDSTNNFIASLTQVGSFFGLAYLDVTTAEFRAIELTSPDQLFHELYRIKPSEIIASPKWIQKHAELVLEMRHSWNCAIHPYEDWHFDHQQAHDYLTQHFKVISLDGFGLKGMISAINAGGGLLHYLHESLNVPIGHITEIACYSTQHFMALDKATQRNLELTESLHDGGKRNTLLDVIDSTHTPMGARLLRYWVKHPLLSLEEIILRQNCIEFLYNQSSQLNSIGRALEGIRDLERLTMKTASGYAMPRDLTALRFTLELLPALIHSLAACGSLPQVLSQDYQTVIASPNIAPIIAESIIDEPPLRLNEGGIFRTGYNAELDELRSISHDSKTWIVNYQQQLRETTGIKTLKVGFTRMFGYYIEVSRGQAERMPSEFERRQTLVNAERFITAELKQFEQKVLSADEKSIALENQLFSNLRQHIATYSQSLQEVAKAIARIDCFQSLAAVALKHNYTKPTLDESNTLHIEAGRHPVIEAANSATAFTPNDTCLDDDKNRLMIITGPNMAGKSTYIRQVALITLLAQIGSFVPAKSAVIGIVDKIFTRIGASDDLSRGLSTFMVEMTETANILHNATNKSLVILDEIGRGTSTYDGISIAWSVAEYLLTHPQKTAKTLFATHYWELTKLEELFPGAVNLNVAIHEHEGQIHFLHKIVKGVGDKSYGIHVARLAGLPAPVVNRAYEVLAHLEQNSNQKAFISPPKVKKPVPKKTPASASDFQLTFFS
jgi:DNA mismatch repair protein MutS